MLRVLMVGSSDHGLQCLISLVEEEPDLQEIVILDEKRDGDTANHPARQLARRLKAFSPELEIECRIEDPLNLITVNPNLVLSVQLAIACDVSRSVEEALGAILWRAPPRVLIIAREDGFNIKFRSQYVEHRVTDEPGYLVLRGIDLHTDPERDTAAKVERVRKTMSTCVDMNAPGFQSYLVLAMAACDVFEEVYLGRPGAGHGPLALTGHEDEVKKRTKKIVEEKGLNGISIDSASVTTCCNAGLSALPQTALIMGSMMAQEGLKLLRSFGRPTNVCLIDVMLKSALGYPVGQ